MFNAGIWTVHFGIDNVGHDSQRRIRDVIRCVGLISAESVSVIVDVQRYGT